MSTDATENTPAAMPLIFSKFIPIIFTNAPEEDDDVAHNGDRQKLKQWLGRMVRITLKNKMILMGIFSCTDHDMNLVIANCDTIMPNDDEPIPYGNITVHGDQIVTFEVDMPTEDSQEGQELRVQQGELHIDQAEQ